jgi:hypothetical protein
VEGVRADLYTNEDGKGLGLPLNGRATDFLVPGVGLFFGDYVAGDAVLIGFDAADGTHQDVPPGSRSRIELITQEAGTPVR